MSVDQQVAADRLRELGLPLEAELVASAAACIDALLWTASFRHCCTGRPTESHQRDCRVAEVLHRIDINFWSFAEVAIAHREALEDWEFLRRAEWDGVRGDVLAPSGRWWRLGTAPAPPASHARATGGSTVPG